METEMDIEECTAPRTRLLGSTNQNKTTNISIVDNKNQTQVDDKEYNFSTAQRTQFIDASGSKVHFIPEQKSKITFVHRVAPEARHSPTSGYFIPEPNTELNL